MRKVGELAMPVFTGGIDSLEKAAKGVLGDLSREERQKFYEDVKRDIRNPAYRLQSPQYPPLLPGSLTSVGGSSRRENLQSPL